MLKKCLCVLLSLILSLYLVVIILTIENYKIRPVGLGYEYAHSESTYFKVYSKAYSLDYEPYTNTIGFVDYVPLVENSEADYRIEFEALTSVILESIELNSMVYIDKAYVSHITLDNYSPEPYIPIHNLLGRFYWAYSFDDNGHMSYKQITFECVNYEIVLDSETIMGVVGNNLAIASIDFDFEIESVTDFLEWCVNFVRSIYNFGRNIIADFKGGF